MRHVLLLGSVGAQYKKDMNRLRQKLSKLEGIALLPKKRYTCDTNHSMAFHHILLYRAKAQYQRDSLQTEIIHSCEFSSNQVGHRQDCSQLFKHVPTHLGMCSSLNPLRPELLFKTNGIPYWSALRKYFNAQDRDLFTNAGSGTKTGMKIILDMNNE